MSIQFCVVRDKVNNTFLCHSVHYSPGYHYSEYTRADASYDINSEFIAIDKIYGLQYDVEGIKSLIIFESRDKATEYINDYFSNSSENYEVIGFAEVDAIVEQMLLGNTSAEPEV